MLTCASIAFFISFGQDFPPQMAVHFNLDGRADGFMDRVKFIVLGSFVSFMVPTFIVAVVGVLPRVLPPSMLNVPNKSYWVAPERRGRAYDTLLWFGLWLATLVQAFLLVVNIGLYRANLIQPPALGASDVIFALPATLLLVGVAGTVFLLFRGFRIPRSSSR